MNTADELQQLREERDQLKLELEQQTACTNSLLESQDRLAVHIGELQEKLSSAYALIQEITHSDDLETV